MPELDLDLMPEPPPAAPVLAARQRRALVTGLGGGRAHDAVVAARGPWVERRLRASDTAVPAFLPELAGATGNGFRAEEGADGRVGGGEDVGVLTGRPGRRSHREAGPDGIGLRTERAGVADAGTGAPRASRAQAPLPAHAGASAHPGASPQVCGDVPAWLRRAGGDTPAARGIPVAGMDAAAACGNVSGKMPCRGEAVAAGAELDGAPPAGPRALAARAGSRDAAAPAPAASSSQPLRLDDALVVPAGALLRGYLRCRALLLAGDVVGNVHCVAGPVVIRAGASLKGRLVAAGDVYVCGTVGEAGGGAVISTRGKLTLAPGARVDGDVRCGWLDVHDGALLQGVARASED